MLGRLVSRDHKILWSERGTRLRRPNLRGSASAARGPASV